MKRETKTITTPVGKQELELLAWINGREKRELRRIFLEKANLGGDGNVNNASLNIAEVTDQAEDRAIQLIVLSIGGETENILDKILDMKAKDYNFVIEEINKVSKDDDFLA